MQFKKNDNADFGITEVIDNIKKRFSKQPEVVQSAYLPPKKGDARREREVKAAIANSLSRRGAMKDNIKKVKSQKALENLIDSDMGDSINPKTGKLSIVAGWAGGAERNLLRSGKASDNAIVRGAADGLEGFGKLGFRQGATGARGVLNKVVGRTGTGKVARTLGLLGSVGVGKAALRKRNERF